MPRAASAGARSRFQSFPWRAVSSDTRSRIASSVWPAPSPSAERTGTPASSSSSRPATRTMKNSSRPCEKIAANFSRSRSGRRSSSASSSTRAPNSTHDSSRLRRREGAGSVAVAIVGSYAGTWCRTSVRHLTPYGEVVRRCPTEVGHLETSTVGTQRLDDEGLKPGDQLLRLREQRPRLEAAARDAALHVLHEHAILRADLIVECEVVGEPLVVRVGTDEVVEEAVGAVRAARDDRADRQVRLPGHDVHDRAGEQEVELAAGDLALRIRGTCVGARLNPGTDAVLLRRAELARDPAARLEPVGVGRDVEHLREARVRDRAVVALDEVLPVARVLLGLGPRVEAERAHVDAVGGEKVGKLAEVVCERRGLRIRVDEDERPPRVDRHTDETEAGHVEPELAIRAGRASQRAVEAVGPRVVRALDRLAARVAVAEDVPAVAADVDEAAELVVPAAREQDGKRSGPGRRQLPGLGDLVVPGCVLPRAREDSLLLEAEDGRVRVPVVWKRSDSGDGRHRSQSTPVEAADRLAPVDVRVPLHATSQICTLRACPTVSDSRSWSALPASRSSRRSRRPPPRRPLGQLRPARRTTPA